MPSKITLGIILSSLGMAISLASPLIHILLVSLEVKSILGHELAAGFPLHLLLSILGVPVAVTGLFFFRRGVREELSTEGEISLGREVVLERLEREGLLNVEENQTVKERSVTMEKEPPLGKIRVKSSGLTLICPKCGAEASLDESKCKSCGEKFNKSRDPARACPICSGDLIEAQRLEDNTYVCNLCFSELEIDTETARRIFG